MGGFLRGRQAAAFRLELKAMGVPVLDDDQVRHAGGHTQALQDCRFDRPPCTTVWNMKGKNAGCWPKLQMLNDRTLDLCFGLLATTGAAAVVTAATHDGPRHDVITVRSDSRSARSTTLQRCHALGSMHS